MASSLEWLIVLWQRQARELCTRCYWSTDDKVTESGEDIWPETRCLCHEEDWWPREAGMVLQRRPVLLCCRTGKLGSGRLKVGLTLRETGLTSGEIWVWLDLCSQKLDSCSPPCSSPYPPHLPLLCLPSRLPFHLWPNYSSPRIPAASFLPGSLFPPNEAIAVFPDLHP